MIDSIINKIKNLTSNRFEGAILNTLYGSAGKSRNNSKETKREELFMIYILEEILQELKEIKQLTQAKEVISATEDLPKSGLVTDDVVKETNELQEIKDKLTEKGIKFHPATGIAKLKELLEKSE